MKTYIEFGAPKPDMSHLKTVKILGYKTIVIDFQKYDFMDEEIYKLLVDETYLNYWSDPLDIPLADKWVCFSSLEHTPYSDVHKEVEAIASKVNGRGEIGIDLTDHSGGFDHVESPEDFQKHFSAQFYLNGIGYEQWIDIISEYFTFSKIEEVYCKDQVGHITFRNCESKE
tara:strand:+ start:545 stop:1057 length:513 start_codon:yes stop_codon:yes gene_type:complete